MLKTTSCLLAVALLCSFSQPGVCLRADEPVKTGAERDTLLYVRTNPPGAKVFLNGKELGTSDGLFHVEPGTGSILIELEGCKPDQKQVIIRANGITRVELALKPQSAGKAKIKAESESEDGRFIARLPQGTVELVGVTEDYRPTQESRWWRPDGSAASIGPFYAVQKYRSPLLIADDKVRTILVRIENLPADASRDSVGGVNFSTTAHRGVPHLVAGEGPRENPGERFTGSPSWSVGGPSAGPDGPSHYDSTHLWEETDVYLVREARRAYGAPAPTYGDFSRGPSDCYYQAYSTPFAYLAKTTDLRVGISLGEWDTVVTRKPGSAGLARFSREGREWSVLFGKPTVSHSTITGYTTRVAVTSTPRHTYGQWKVRLMAVAGDGSQQVSWIGSADGTRSTMDGDSGVAVFRNLSLSSIKEFRLQVRPFRCVEFDNISLEPGQKTQVTVISSDDSGNAKN